MDEIALRFLSIRRLPHRLGKNETAWLLGFNPPDIPILVAHKLLKPLGHPPANACKYFDTGELEALREDKAWRVRATDVILQYWQGKNQRKASYALKEEHELPSTEKPPIHKRS
jgi:hypothetical protein